MPSGPTPRRILVIDDDPVSLAVTAILLESEGWIVLQADSGERALELLASPGDSGLPDCILTDLLMPTLSGPELAARLGPLVPAARLVAMSATPPPAVEGYDAVLRKPLSIESLLAALAACGQPSEVQPSCPDPESPESCAVIIDDAVFLALQRAMSNAGLAEVAQTFLQDAATRLQVMRTADPATAMREAHTIKGGASMIGAFQVAMTASVLEQGIDHHGDRQDKLDELELCLRRVETMLKQRLSF